MQVFEISAFDDAASFGFGEKVFDIQQSLHVPASTSLRAFLVWSLKKGAFESTLGPDCGGL